MEYNRISTYIFYTGTVNGNLDKQYKINRPNLTYVSSRVHPHILTQLVAARHVIVPYKLVFVNRF